MAHYRNGSSYIGQFSDGAEPPSDAVECPAPPHANATWVSGAWVYNHVPSSVPRGSFLVAAASAGFISEATAEEAADGTWPAAFNAFLSGLNAQQRVIAKANWSTATNIRRDAPLLAQIASAAGASSTDLDDMFRATAEIEA